MPQIPKKILKKLKTFDLVCRLQNFSMPRRVVGYSKVHRSIDPVEDFFLLLLYEGGLKKWGDLGPQYPYTDLQSL